MVVCDFPSTKKEFHDKKNILEKYCNDIDSTLYIAYRYYILDERILSTLKNTVN